MEDFSFIQITDHHLLESEEALCEGFCPRYAFRMVMRHISENAADKADFIISTGDLVEPDTDATYQGAVKLLGMNSSAAHIQLASGAHKDKAWKEKATQEIITLLRDDYPTLMAVLGALGEL